MRAEELETIRQAGREARIAWARENGRPVKVTDPKVLAQVAAIVRGGDKIEQAA